MTRKPLSKEKLETQYERFGELAITQIDHRLVQILDAIPLWIIKLYVDTKEEEKKKKNKRKA